MRNILFVILYGGQVSSFTASERAAQMISDAGGKFACRTDLERWRFYWEAYQTTRMNPSEVNMNIFQDTLYDIVLTNHTRVFECNAGVIAGYSLIGSWALDRMMHALAYRSFQMAMVFVYTLRSKQVIPPALEIEWNVSKLTIVEGIQELKRVQDIPPARHTRDSTRKRIAVVSICAYSDDHDLILKDITPINRQRYAARHGYDALVYDRHPAGPDSDVCIQHSKLLAMHSILSSGKYDWVMWTDCDSMIVNNQVSLESIINTYADECTDLLITEELLGISSANWIIRHSDWSKQFLVDAFKIANDELPLFGDQDAIISLAIGKGSLDPHIKIIPQHIINAYDALNAWAMGGGGYEKGDLLVTFPQCNAASCNALFYEAFKASEDNGVEITTIPVKNRTIPQVRVFGPPGALNEPYQNTV